MFSKWSIPSGSRDSRVCLLFIRKRGLGCLLFIDCWLFNHLRPTYGMNDLALVRNPFPDGDITGEPQRRVTSKEGNNKASRSVWTEGKWTQHFSLHWARACVFANVPFSDFHLLSVRGDFISHGDIWDVPLCQVHLPSFLQVTWHLKHPYTFTYVATCTHRSGKPKPSTPQGHFVLSFPRKEWNSEGRAE